MTDGTACTIRGQSKHAYISIGPGEKCLQPSDCYERRMTLQRGFEGIGGWTISLLSQLLNLNVRILFVSIRRLN